MQQVKAQQIQTLIQQLSQHSNVDLIIPEDKRYDSARLVYNRMHDVFPLMIVRTLDPDILRNIMSVAHQYDFPLAVRGGGHHIAGFGTCDQGIVIDFSPFKKINIDKNKHLVTIEPGALLADVDEALTQAGFVLPTGTVSQTGLAGLTLGGGIGWLTGKFGLTCDHLYGADVLLANGQLVHAEDPEHQDLLWALRGGGGNFGLVLKFKFKIHPLPKTICGMGIVLWENTLNVSHLLLDYLQHACPASLTIAPIFAKDEQNTPYFRIDFCCAEADIDVLSPLLSLSPLITWSEVRTWSFSAWQKAFDDAFLPPMRGYWKACYVENMQKDMFKHLYSCFTASPSKRCSILIEHLHGAFKQCTIETSAFPLRQCQFGILFSARWENEADDQCYKDWVRQSFRLIDPHEKSKTYLNYTHKEDDRALETLLTDAENALKRVKTLYDPNNCFSKNHNVLPQN